jgi:guanylate kinase
MLFVISAPSGAGKTTIIKELFKKLPGLSFSVSATTRQKRISETDNVDYYFLTEKEFKDSIKHGDFVEWEKVFGNYYGTLKSELKKGAKDDVNLILDVDVKGALNIKKLFPGAVTIFIEAPKEDLVKRLKQRNTDTGEQIDKRIQRMQMELKLKNEFDHVVMNKTNHEGVEKAVEEIINIINK